MCVITPTGNGVLSMGNETLVDRGKFEPEFEIKFFLHMLILTRLVLNGED